MFGPTTVSSVTLISAEAYNCPEALNAFAPLARFWIIESKATCGELSVLASSMLTLAYSPPSSVTPAETENPAKPCK